MLKIKLSDLSHTIKEIIEEMELPQAMCTSNVLVNDKYINVPDVAVEFNNITQYSEFMRRVKVRMKNRYVSIVTKKAEDKHD